MYPVLLPSPPFPLSYLSPSSPLSPLSPPPSLSSLPFLSSLSSLPLSFPPSLLLPPQALLTIMTSSTVEVHGSTVLQAVRCCYNIYLASKNMINQTTARASLSQILSTLFQKMENDPVRRGGRKEEEGESWGREGWEEYFLGGQPTCFNTE